MEMKVIAKNSFLKDRLDERIKERLAKERLANRESCYVEYTSRIDIPMVQI